MANNKLLHFKTKNRFELAIQNDEIPEGSIAFIQEGTDVYTHSTLYAHYDEYRDGDYNMNNCLEPGIYYNCTLGRPFGSVDKETYVLRVANLGKTTEDTVIPLTSTQWKFDHDQSIDGWANYNFDSETFNQFDRILDPSTGRPIIFNELYYSALQQNSQSKDQRIFYLECTLPKSGIYQLSFDIAALNTHDQNIDGMPLPLSDSKVDINIIYNDGDEQVRIPYHVNTLERYGEQRYHDGTPYGTVVSYNDVTTIEEEIDCVGESVIVEVRLNNHSNANWFLFRTNYFKLVEPEMDVIEQTCSSANLDHRFSRILYSTDRSKPEPPFTLYMDWQKDITNKDLNNLIESDYNGVIDKFNEVKEFLGGISDSLTTLTDALNAITPIAYSGTEEKQNGVHKTTNNSNTMSEYAQNSLIFGRANTVAVNDPNNTAYYPEDVVVEGNSNYTEAKQSHAEGLRNIIRQDVNQALTDLNLTSLRDKYNLSTPGLGADCAHAEGLSNVAAGWVSHVEGNENVTYGPNSHAEGHANLAKGSSAHAEGRSTMAIGNYSHAQGRETVANGVASFAAGFHTQANNSTKEGEAALGRYNVSTNGTIFSVGIGTSDSDRRNAITVKENGEVEFWNGVGNNPALMSSLISLTEASYDTIGIVQSGGKLKLETDRNNGNTESTNIPTATTSADGVMSAADKTKLNSAYVKPSAGIPTADIANEAIDRDKLSFEIATAIPVTIHLNWDSNDGYTCTTSLNELNSNSLYITFPEGHVPTYANRIDLYFVKSVDLSTLNATIQTATGVTISVDGSNIPVQDLDTRYTFPVTVSKVSILQDDEVVTSKINQYAVTEDKLAPASVTHTKIGAGAVQWYNIEDETIRNRNLDYEDLTQPAVAKTLLMDGDDIPNDTAHRTDGSAWGNSYSQIIPITGSDSILYNAADISSDHNIINVSCGDISGIIVLNPDEQMQVHIVDATTQSLISSVTIHSLSTDISFNAVQNHLYQVVYTGHVDYTNRYKESVNLEISEVDVIHPAIVSSNGSSSNRPAIRNIGTMYFDTTLGKPIYWNGTNWVDATGTSV